jgi:hypothetical protein
MSRQRLAVAGVDGWNPTAGSGDGWTAWTHLDPPSRVRDRGKRTARPVKMFFGPGWPTVRQGWWTIRPGGPAIRLGGPTIDLGWPTIRLGGPTIRPGRRTTRPGGPSFRLGWPMIRLGWPMIRLGWPMIRLGWPTIRLGGPTTKSSGPKALRGRCPWRRGRPNRGRQDPRTARRGRPWASGGPGGGCPAVLLVTSVFKDRHASSRWTLTGSRRTGVYGGAGASVGSRRKSPLGRFSLPVRRRGLGRASDRAMQLFDN